MARICVPVCVARVSELPNAIRNAADVADVIELRLDYLPEHELRNSLIEISEIARTSPRPIILTLRPAEQGGHRELTVQDRLLFRINSPAHVSRPEDLCDVELDLALPLAQRRLEGSDSLDSGFCDWEHTICSHHDFVGVPPDLEDIYRRLAQTGARVLKLAVQTDDVIECLPIFQLLDQARREHREFIGIAMGLAGAVTRILGPSRGSYLTYGSLDDESATAPGQLTARELRDVYRIDAINSDTQVFGIVGNPVSQSLSPYIHNAAFAAAQLNAVYVPLPTRDIKKFMRRMAHPRTRELVWQLRGLSITIPHKRAVMPLLDFIDPIAETIGAVNTIVVQDDQLVGYNTDAAGFISPLRERLGAMANSRCAVIGSGGAARAAVWALRNERAEVTVFARNRSSAKDVGDTFGVPFHDLENADFSGFDVVVNATPLGTRGANETATPAKAAQLARVRLAYDLVYNPTETRFLIEARQVGCETVGGIEMLLAQAIEQFKLWTGANADLRAMQAAVKSGHRE